MILSDEVARNLPRLRDGFLAKTGGSFQHFFCPLLHQDEPVELCMGHVIPACLPGSSRARVVQRADVDNFYGAVAEADFGLLIEAREKGVEGVMFDEGLRKRVRPRFVLDGQTVPYYPFKKGNMAPGHSRVLIRDGLGGQDADLVFAKTPAEIAAADAKAWGVRLDRDGRLAAVVTLIKAAYLTMFRMHGYEWALSAGGIEIGHNILGRFYRENRGKSVSEVRSAAKPFFFPHRHMVRPILEYLSDEPPRGTVEDNRAGIWFGIDGRVVGLVVYLRVNESLHAVLLPVPNDAEAAVAYWDFIQDDTRETLTLSEAIFNDEERRWDVRPQPATVHWPKRGETFKFD